MIRISKAQGAALFAVRLSQVYPNVQKPRNNKVNVQGWLLCGLPWSLLWLCAWAERRVLPLPCCLHPPWGLGLGKGSHQEASSVHSPWLAAEELSPGEGDYWWSLLGSSPKLRFHFSHFPGVLKN